MNLCVTVGVVGEKQTKKINHAQNNKLSFVHSNQLLMLIVGCAGHFLWLLSSSATATAALTQKTKIYKGTKALLCPPVVQFCSALIRGYMGGKKKKES